MAGPKKFDWDVIVIGAGAAGMMAGIAAARGGARVLVCEGREKPGRKIAMTGGGRCNFSNTLSPREFIRSFGDPHAIRLGHALRAFSSKDLITLLESRAVQGVVEKEWRLYTKSGNAEDVVSALVAELADLGVRIRINCRISLVSALEGEGGYLVESEGGAAFEAPALVISTGGLSYPATGSTGEGHGWARALGHCFTRLQAALVGFTVKEEWPSTLSGLSVPHVSVALLPPPGRSGKAFARERGELLFTHFGVSGPPVLDLSNRFVGGAWPEALLQVDFLPDLQPEAVEKLLQRRFALYPRRSAAKALAGVLPGRLLAVFATDPVPAGEITRKSRKAILAVLKQTRLVVTGTRGIQYGEVTSGGVVWEEIDPADLQSRLKPGLFFAGEILDLAGRCGGFNLQAAFSTGYLAGKSAAGVASR